MTLLHIANNGELSQQCDANTPADNTITLPYTHSTVAAFSVARPSPSCNSSLTPLSPPHLPTTLSHVICRAERGHHVKSIVRFISVSVCSCTHQHPKWLTTQTTHATVKIHYLSLTHFLRLGWRKSFPPTVAQPPPSSILAQCNSGRTGMTFLRMVQCLPLGASA